MSAPSIHPQTRLGHVHLIITNMERSLEFYRQALGFQLHRRQNNTAYLGAGQADLLVLTERPQARAVTGATGLYHFAVLVPSRLELAQSLRRLAQTGAPVQGFADHWVSEAIYLPDPDGNGIEIYRDRPQSEWPYQNGQLQMATDPLNIDEILAELNGHAEDWPGLHPQTTLGHIHLHVASIPQAEAFYHNILGFDLILRYGPSASFLSAGGYHHHIGINTWAGKTPPPPNAVGLRWFTICLPNELELNSVASRARQAGVEIEERDEGLLLRDPAQNGLILTTP